MGYVLLAIPSRKHLLLLLAEWRTSGPAFRPNDILGFKKAMLLLPCHFSLKGWTILKSVQPLLETLGFIKSRARAGKGRSWRPQQKCKSQIEYWRTHSNCKNDPHGFTVSDSLALQGQSHRPLSGRTFPLSGLLVKLFLYKRTRSSDPTWLPRHFRRAFHNWTQLCWR